MSEQAEGSASIQAPAKVLVVDDSRADFDLCQLLLDTAAPDCWRLEWADDYQTGLAALLAGGFDLALIDHGLAGDSGVRLIREATAASCRVPMVLFTGSENPEVEREGLAAGAIDFLPKNQLDARRLERICRLTVERERLFDSHRGSIRRLASRNQALRILLHNADGLLVCTPQNRIVYMNPAAEALLAGGRRNADDDHLPPALQDLEDGAEAELPRPGGGERLLSVGVRGIRWDDAPCQLLSLRDVTSTRRMAERIHQGEKMALLGQIAGGIAHDFNNLMMAVLGNIDLAREGVPPELRNHLEGAADAAAKAARLTSRLLAVARRKHREPEQVDLQALLEHTAPLLRLSTREGVRLELVCEEPLWVYADPLELEQVLLNLVTNAGHAVSEGGSIELAVQRVEGERSAADFVGAVPAPGPCVLIAVQDDGVGIPKADLARVFEPFYTTRAGGQAAGLGLSVVDRIAREAGGGVRLQSRPGRTRFELVLPAAEPPDEADEAPPSLRTAPAARLEVLVVDDEEPVRQVVAQTLTALGHQVTTACDGIDALDGLDRGGPQPDVLITDISMPRMDGFELAEALGARFPGLPVVFISGLPEEYFERADNDLVGPVEVLRKPFRLAQLERRLRAVLEES